jgi:hypothetical protein
MGEQDDKTRSFSANPQAAADRTNRSSCPRRGGYLAIRIANDMKIAIMGDLDEI